MEIHQYLALLRHWLWLIILGGAVAAVSAFAISRFQEPVYRATSILLINESLATNDNNSFQSLQSSERLAVSFVIRLTNYEVLTESITELGLDMTADELQKAVQVNSINNSQLISLNVEGHDPQIITALANEIPQKFAEHNMAMQLERFADSKINLEDELALVAEELILAESALNTELNDGNRQLAVDRLSGNMQSLRETHSRLLQSYEDIRVAEAENLNNIIIEEYARVPEEPIRPRIVTNTLLAGMVGIMLAIGVIFLIEYLDDTVKDSSSLEHITGLNVLGIITKQNNLDKDAPPVMVTQLRSPNAEAYRQVRTNVQYVGVSQELSTILVTSPSQGEGKSTIATNLAITLAQSNNKVVLIDCDMRRPTLHRKFNLPNNVGLTNLLLSKEDDPSFIQETGTENLRIITTGSLPPNPAELIQSERMQHILDWLNEVADYIVIDSPPALVVTDSILLSQIASITMLVVAAGKTRQQSLLLAIQRIKAVDGYIAGIIINKVHARHSSYYYHNYYAYQSDYFHTNNSANDRHNMYTYAVRLSAFLLSIIHHANKY